MANDRNGGFFGTAGQIVALVAGIPAAIVAIWQLYLVVTGQRSLLDYFTSAPMVVVAPAGGTPANCAEPREAQLWQKAAAEKTRAAFNTYLASYQNCPNSNHARDVLLSCRTVSTEAWKPGPDVANQMVRGVSTVSDHATSEAQACAIAKSDVRAKAKLMCQTITTNGGYRNPMWTVSDAACACENPSANIFACTADLPYSCRWEMKVTEQVEICG